MKIFALLLFVTGFACLASAAKKTPSGEFLDGFFFAGFRIKTDFSKCREAWRDGYLEHRAQQAVDHFGNLTSIEGEAKAICTMWDLVDTLSTESSTCKKEY